MLKRFIIPDKRHSCKGSQLNFCILLIVNGRFYGQIRRFAAFMILSGILQACAGGRRAPIMNDVTTDPYNPPQFQKIAELPDNKGRDMSYPKKNIAIQEKE